MLIRHFFDAQKYNENRRKAEARLHFSCQLSRKVHTDPGFTGTQAQFLHVMDQDITIIMLGNTSVIDSDAWVESIATRAIH